MRRMSANNHRGQEAKIFQKQAGYMRAMIFSHIDDQMSCKRSGSIYAGGRVTQEQLPTTAGTQEVDNAGAINEERSDEAICNNLIHWS